MLRPLFLLSVLVAVVALLVSLFFPENDYSKMASQATFVLAVVLFVFFSFDATRGNDSGVIKKLAEEVKNELALLTQAVSAQDRKRGDDIAAVRSEMKKAVVQLVDSGELDAMFSEFKKKTEEGVSKVVSTLNEAHTASWGGLTAKIKEVLEEHLPKAPPPLEGEELDFKEKIGFDHGNIFIGSISPDDWQGMRLSHTSLGVELAYPTPVGLPKDDVLLETTDDEQLIRVGAHQLNRNQVAFLISCLWEWHTKNKIVVPSATVTDDPVIDEDDAAEEEKELLCSGCDRPMDDCDCDEYQEEDDEDDESY